MIGEWALRECVFGLGGGGHNVPPATDLCTYNPANSRTSALKKWKRAKKVLHKSHLLLLGKFEYTGGPIFKVVLEC